MAAPAREEYHVFVWQKETGPQPAPPGLALDHQEGGTIHREFTWENIEYDLAQLYPDNDSFLILEQKDPKNDKNYWYIQSAIALRGPDKDNYVVGVGWNGETGPVLMERCYHWKDLDTMIELFRQAFQRKPLDLTGYESFF